MLIDHTCSGWNIGVARTLRQSGILPDVRWKQVDHEPIHEVVVVVLVSDGIVFVSAGVASERSPPIAMAV